jgi:zinc protease
VSVDRSAPPPPGPVRAFDAPRLQRWRLDNGMTVLAAERGALPLLTAAVVVDAGGAAEGTSSAGVASLTANALDAGTARRSASELAEAFENLGAELGASVSWDAAVVQVTVAAARIEPALELLAEVVREPSFPAAELERVRGEQRAGLLQRRSEPRSLASDMAVRCIYTEEAQYARPLAGTLESVERLKRDDVVAFHRARFTPAGAAFILTGALAGTDAAELAARYFGDWQGGLLERVEPDVTPATERTTIYVVDRPGSVQSEIRVGHVGVPRSHPDYFALEVMNSLLGGAFTSRLNMNLRERHGFTYGARSEFSYRRASGPFLIQTAVATDVTARAVAEILREMRDLVDGGAVDDETAAARDYVAGVVPLRLQTTEQIAARIGEIFVHGLDDDYLSRFQAGIRSVSVRDVNRVAREQIRLDALAIVVVGDGDAITPALEELSVGPVTRITA